MLLAFFHNGVNFLAMANAKDEKRVFPILLAGQ
jgi:hypothetical protein